MFLMMKELLWLSSCSKTVLRKSTMRTMNSGLEMKYCPTR